MQNNYTYHEATSGLCPKCMSKVAAKIIIRDNSVYLKKYCDKHSESEDLLEEDASYHLKKREYDKPGTSSKKQTKITKGCPYDCGLCPNHDQHTCIALIEITDNCDLKCPVCYANSDKGDFLSIEKFSKMLDFLIGSEGGEAEILQISGGEPTTHPQIIDLIRLARTKKIRYLMINTNGLRIANDENFVKDLAQFRGNFEIYLQFDGFLPETYDHFRGRDLSKIKLKAIENLNKYDIPITLVSTIQKNVNDKEIADIIKFGIKTRGIRGVNFQPVAYFGRTKTDIDVKNRITLSGVIQRIENDLSSIFMKGDIVPLPCNVERVAVTYMVKDKKGNYVPVTRKVKVKSYLPLIDNTFAFDIERVIKNNSKNLLTAEGCCNCMNFIKDFRNLVPLTYLLKTEEGKIKYVNENTFRISVTSFIDAYNFDIKSMQKECVHIITQDLKRIPFSAYNMIHRK